MHVWNWKCSTFLPYCLLICDSIILCLPQFSLDPVINASTSERFNNCVFVCVNAVYVTVSECESEKRMGRGGYDLDFCQQCLIWKQRWPVGGKYVEWWLFVMIFNKPVSRIIMCTVSLYKKYGICPVDNWKQMIQVIQNDIRNKNICM